MKRIVVKFGGTSVMDSQRIARAAEIVEQFVYQGYQIIVVVSAMGHTTDHLIDLANSLSLAPDAREMDLLMSTGEIVSATLMTIALQARGIAARSFTGADAGIVTDSGYGNAHITDIESDILEVAMALGKVAVVAGFQGISHDGEVTTLGRGGSDTTAIALAAALKAERCDIYTDVDGVYDSDPKRSSIAKKYEFIGYEEMLHLARNGAQVLNARSVEIAQEQNVMVQVRSTFEPEKEGTLVLAASAIPVRS